MACVGSPTPPQAGGATTSSSDGAGVIEQPGAGALVAEPAVSSCSSRRRRRGSGVARAVVRPSVAVCPGRAGVVYLGVTPTRRLLRLHHELHGRLAAVGVESGRHYLPDAWVPHCTLAQGLTPEQVPMAVRAVNRLRPVEADVVEVGIQNTDTGNITPIAELPHSQRAE